MGHTECNSINLTFPHWALVDSRMGPLWHGTQASGADKTKNKGSSRIKVHHVGVNRVYSMAVSTILVGFNFKRNSQSYVSHLIFFPLWSRGLCFLLWPRTLKAF